MAAPGVSVDFTSRAPVAVTLPVSWVSPSATPEPPIRVQWSDPHTVVLRQAFALNYEAPFLYLLFGNDRALLLDTGATGDPVSCPLRGTVDGLVEEWLARHPRERYPLVVAHSHGHGDHVAGDAQFADRADTTVVGTDRAAVAAFFGTAGAPDDGDGLRAPVLFDLGGRTLEILATPGHHRAAITVFDPWTGWLLTGDTVYPGRLYVEDMPAFRASLDTLVAFAAHREVTQVMGCHIEMSRTPGRDHPLGSTRHAQEPPLQLPVSVLTAVRNAAQEVADAPGIHRFDRFVIVHGSGVMVRARLRGRALMARLRLPRPRS